MADSGYLRASVIVDQERAKLQTVLRSMEDNSPGFVDRLMDQLWETYNAPDTDVADRMLYHAAFVGVTTTMQQAVDASEQTGG